MALAGTIVVGVALLLGALNGLRRAAVKEGMALVGVLLGALLVSLWTDRWGLALASRFRWQPVTGQWIAARGTLWGTALLAGYGSGSLLPRRAVRMSSSLRGGGAVLGLLNAGLLLGLTLRYMQTLLYGETATGPKATWIRAAVASRFLLERFDLIVLGVAWSIAALSLIVTLVQLVRRLFARPQPATTPAPTNPSAVSNPKPVPATPIYPGGTATSSATTAPGMERSFIDKPRTPSGGS